MIRFFIIGKNKDDSSLWSSERGFIILLLSAAPFASVPCLDFHLVLPFSFVPCFWVF